MKPAEQHRDPDGRPSDTAESNVCSVRSAELAPLTFRDRLPEGSDEHQPTTFQFDSDEDLSPEHICGRRNSTESLQNTSSLLCSSNRQFITPFVFGMTGVAPDNGELDFMLLNQCIQRLPAFHVSDR